METWLKELYYLKILWAASEEKLPSWVKAAGIVTHVSGLVRTGVTEDTGGLSYHFCFRVFGFSSQPAILTAGSVKMAFSGSCIQSHWIDSGPRPRVMWHLRRAFTSHFPWDHVATLMAEERGALLCEKAKSIYRKTSIGDGVKNKCLCNCQLGWRLMQ